MSGQAVAEAIQRAAGRVGLHPTRFASHSLRAGMATAAAQTGTGEVAIQRQGRWRSLVVRRYVRHGSLYVATPQPNWGCSCPFPMRSEGPGKATEKRAVGKLSPPPWFVRRQLAGVR